MAKKKIDPLNKKAYGAVSAALTVADIPAVPAGRSVFYLTSHLIGLLVQVI